jgi:DNA mismatch endonuclease (patch repair protein)
VPPATNRPRAGSEEIRRKMSEQRRRDTKPEIAIRRILHSRGYRYRVDYRLPGTRRRADVAFTKIKLAVFVDGCFWHSCRLHGTFPRTNRDWWKEKLAANAVRDRDTDSRLRGLGWEVLRIWEHEDPSKVVDKIAKAIESARA